MDKDTKLQAAKAKEEAAHQAQQAKAAKRAGKSSATKRKATEAKKAAEAQRERCEAQGIQGDAPTNKEAATNVATTTTTNPAEALPLFMNSVK